MIKSKSRKFHRVMSMLLAVSLVWCMLSAMKTEVGASTASVVHNINNWEFAPGNWVWFVPARQMSVGDVVDFNLTFRGTVNNAPFAARFEVAIMRPDGFLMWLRTHNASGQANTFNTTLRVTQAGQYHIAFLSHSSSATRVIVNGNAIYRPHIRHSSVIRHDATANPSGFSAAFEEASRGFANFGISFNNTGIREFSNLSGACPNNSGPTGICTIQPLVGCAPAWQCGFRHHRSALRLLATDSSNSTYAVRIVGFEICRDSSSVHKQIAGVAQSPGRNSIVTTTTEWSLAELLQHELGHNLGVRDHCNSATVWCVMNDNVRFARINSWCNSCSTQIRNHRG